MVSIFFLHQNLQPTIHRFLTPQQPNNVAVENAFNDSLNNDGALDAYAESIVWRLRGTHAMVRFVEPLEGILGC